MTLTPRFTNPATNGHMETLAADDSLVWVTHPSPDLYLGDEPVARSQKTDPELGRRVAQFLIEKGVATPQVETGLDDTQKRTLIAWHFARIMEALGLDLRDDSLAETPKRVAQMYVDEIFYGLDWRNFPKCTTVENKMGYSSMVVERNINVQSNCEHHFVIIDGRAHVAYIPKRKVLGLSKINRIVEYFAKRPQIQERLTEQIFYALSYILETEDIAVVIQAKHYCVKSRGVEDVNSDTVTSKLGGVFLQNTATRSEFMRVVNTVIAP
ncbi:MAG: GTP cyclohydrolase I FolE [Gloeomargarita sp. SKYG116]|nr:GTP cyclohydrolase I FolE [Gloeomargarita sp. SKYG116]MCS7226349.1 GTP cyclohydrolase I FolE [Gloeomargarita sp. SKYB31]MDW8400259.1 GTP cyclohydrolase I FolE [Gloeomargarita sp. SKYGB_i_bin116]